MKSVSFAHINSFIILAIILTACGSPNVDTQEQPAADSEIQEAGLPEGMVLVPGGTFRMGSERGFPHEGPVHEVTLDSFYLDSHAVTNNQFAVFVEATHFVSEAEKWKWSIVFDPESDETVRVPGLPWWVKVDGADWRHPLGPGSSIEGKGNHPVVQVSWNDAKAYADWAGKRLVTEAEFEYAARGGLPSSEYAWGDDFMVNGEHMANTWTGEFPNYNSGADGHIDLAPVAQYPPNGYGLYDMAGNVWEWCADWYDPRYFRASPKANPRGPVNGVERVQRGGSYLCAPNYCVGYRISHRNKCAADTGLNHVGFRCAKDLEE